MTSVQYLKGVGPKRAKILEKLGIFTVSDLLFYFPRGWQDRRLKQDSCCHTDAEGNVIFLGTAASSKLIETGKSLGIFRATLIGGTGQSIEAYWFKRLSYSYDVFAPLRRDMAQGNLVWIAGKKEDSGPAAHRVRVEEYYMADDDCSKTHAGRIIPVYPLTEGISGKWLRETSFKALRQFSGTIKDPLPDGLLAKRSLPAVSQALWGMHFPNSMQELEISKRRMIYEEFLFLTLAWAIKHRQTHGIKKNYSYEIKRTLLTPFKQMLGFDFTNAQVRVINEIFEDMSSAHPMTRLLQGDVGSGKTVVALSALLLAVENGYQAAFMAPTELLAEQHYMTFSKFLKGLPVRFEILTSRVKPEAKKKIIQETASGKVDILMGTHALIEETVAFSKLRLTVIDEQHKFGVRQRTILRQKGPPMDLLVMTATPIPRTLSLSLYGDLDVSLLDQLPPGRKPVMTLHMAEEQALQSTLEEVSKGRQVYIVYPLIEESDKKELKSVKCEFERLKQGVFKNLRVGMAHGQMPGSQKAKVMENFLRGKLDILLATPVIEVGIDVPSASLMIIQNADRFGLASLHQLRGRVGRGTYESRCILVADCKTPEASERIDILCATQDGFKIGEKDMQMRGPGEALGTMQHGSLELKTGDLIKDAGILQWAIQDKDGILQSDPLLLSEKHTPLRERLLELYNKKLNLIDLA